VSEGERARREAEALREARVCSICSDRHVDAAMVPCGHAAFCFGCADAAQRRTVSACARRRHRSSSSS
jgi:hypothetical protein